MVRGKWTEAQGERMPSIDSPVRLNRRITLRCHDCAKAFEGGPLVATGMAQQHRNETGHNIDYEGARRG